MSNAPVCNINQTQPVTQPTPLTLPNIPVATNLASALTALAAITQIINSMTNRIPINNFPQFSSKNNNSKTAKQSSFIQTNVVKTKQKIYNPDDNTQWVEVEQITGLTMTNHVTGETWSWNQ